MAWTSFKNSKRPHQTKPSSKWAEEGGLVTGTPEVCSGFYLVLKTIKPRLSFIFKKGNNFPLLIEWKCTDHGVKSTSLFFSRKARERWTGVIDAEIHFRILKQNRANISATCQTASIFPGPSQATISLCLIHCACILEANNGLGLCIGPSAPDSLISDACPGKKG